MTVGRSLILSLVVGSLFIPAGRLAAQTHEVIANREFIEGLIGRPQNVPSTVPGLSAQALLRIDTSGRVESITVDNESSAELVKLLARLRGPMVANPAQRDGCHVPSVLDVRLRWTRSAGDSTDPGGVTMAILPAMNPWLEFPWAGCPSLRGVDGAARQRSELPALDASVSVDEEPRFSADELAGRIKYPEVIRRAGIEGQVLVRALVDRDGSVVALRIDQFVHPVLDYQAVSAVAGMHMTPAQKGGQPVPVWIQIPITFKLN